MKIRAKFTIIFLLLSLIPLTLIGVISYKNGEEAIKKSLGLTFQQMAYETIDKVDRSLYEVYHNVQIWSELDLMQEVITSDIDNKISSFLINLNKEYEYFSNINVLDDQGKIIASSHPELIDNVFSGEDYYKNTISGKKYIEDIHLDEVSKTWVVTFSFPIKAKFEEDKIIGVLCANWNAKELYAITQAYKNKGKEKYSSHIMLMQKDGLIISAPEFEKEDIFKKNLIKLGLRSALISSKEKEGYLVEIDEHNKKSLIGYAYSRGYRDFLSLGWVSLVNQDAKVVFAPIEQLKIIIFGIWIVVALIVIIISLILTRRMSNPILKMSQVAARVAQGDFEGRITHVSSDEFGSLIKVFNKMIQDLKEQRFQLVDKDYVESIIANMADTLIVVDFEGIIKTVNKATEELLGYKERELAGKPVGVLFAGGKKDSVFIGDNWKILIEKGLIRNYSINYRAKNGDIIPVSFNGTVMRNKESRPVGIVGIARDMREIKHLEAQLIKSEKLAAVGELAAGVAHEINNPLNVISGNAELLSMQSQDSNVKHVTTIIKQQVKRAATITERLLQFSRRVAPKIERININKILEDALYLLGYQTKYHNIKIIKDLNPGLPEIMADILQLQEVFLNIMLNAVQAMPDGGELAVRTYAKKIIDVGDRKSAMFTEGDTVITVEVKDTGTGIPPEKLDKIFDPFFTTKQDGTGLGLSICLGIIEAHQGSIEAQSKIGEGTTFIIQLPAHAKQVR